MKASVTRYELKVEGYNANAIPELKAQGFKFISKASPETGWEETKLWHKYVDINESIVPHQQLVELAHKFDMQIVFEYQLDCLENLTGDMKAKLTEQKVAFI